MKAKSLQFGKAMSAALFVLLPNVVGLKNALAQNLVATLQHGDDISMYYGSNAFVQAHEAAQTGDIITLSSGTFNPTTITKAITLRGAGCCMDTVTGIYPTIFENSITANVSDNENSLTIEGILFNSTFYFGILNNPRFIKCNLDYLYNYNNSSMMQNAQFVDCMIYGISGFTRNSSIYATNTQFANCYVLSSSFYNCISIKISDLFTNQTNSTNMSMSNLQDVFETFNGSYNGFEGLIYERFILKSDFASSFLGNDGTEVGIHGGQAPYNPRPNYMVLKQCNVANQSTIDGKLSVEIQVVSEGE